MELNIANSSKKLELANDVFGCEFNEALIHQIVTAYMAGARAGTKAQKTRAEVRGGGAKPFKQKGTGRARAGTIRSPIWRTGGVTFAAKPRSFKQKVNKKMYRGAIRSILSELIRQDRMIVVDSFEVESLKTKALLAKLKAMQVEGRVLIVSDTINEELFLSSRNIPGVELRDSITLASDPIGLVSADKVIITEAAIKEIEGLLK